jgi:lysophospholipase L1-like esterase
MGKPPLHEVPLRIVALGDSTTAGTPGFQSPLEAPPLGRGDETSQYAWWLMTARPAWEVLNRGVNGERSDEIRARFNRDVLRVQPRVVVIIAGVNDVYQGRSAAHAIEHLRAMYRAAAQGDIRVVAGSILPFNTATFDQNARMREVNAWIEDYATSDANLSFADTRRAVASSEDADRLAGSPDELHPDPEGYRRLADVLLPELDRISDLTGRISPDRL